MSGSLPSGSKALVLGPNADVPSPRCCFSFRDDTARLIAETARDHAFKGLLAAWV
ncbi:hypothetical protein BTHI11S_05643 [Bosea thiooxidans]|uniref:hypothetical protein n=1 Tax=Bosea thiooxidans TaxID=53254 RepID=UPI000ABEABE1|nr:hypothetical protein [Bosea thiooxidans]